MAEPLVPGPSRLEVEIVIAKLKKYKSPGSHQILAELIQAGGEILLSEIHKWRKLHNEELHDLYSSPSIIRIIKSRRMRWMGHVAQMGRRGTLIDY
jgi:hypothetical protein